ncbi:MAG: hypothetical protein IJ758_00515 [Clostridia bacterium]|nr:hypothetical protein [Clostridia bacterium]
MKKVIATILSTITLLSATTLIANAESEFETCLQKCFELSQTCLYTRYEVLENIATQESEAIDTLAKKAENIHRSCTMVLETCLGHVCFARFALNVGFTKEAVKEAQQERSTPETTWNDINLCKKAKEEGQRERATPAATQNDINL